MAFADGLSPNKSIAYDIIYFYLNLSIFRSLSFMLNLRSNILTVAAAAVSAVSAVLLSTAIPYDNNSSNSSNITATREASEKKTARKKEAKEDLFVLDEMWY